MKDLKMGPLISGIRDEVEKPSLIQRIRRSVKRVLSRVSWTLWGRRRTFARMRQLALVTRDHHRDPMKEEERISKNRRRLSSMHRETIPTPDRNDSGLN